MEPELSKDPSHLCSECKSSSHSECSECSRIEPLKGTTRTDDVCCTTDEVTTVSDENRVVRKSLGEEMVPRDKGCIPNQENHDLLCKILVEQTSSQNKTISDFSRILHSPCPIQRGI